MEAYRWELVADASDVTADGTSDTVSTEDADAALGLEVDDPVPQTASAVVKVPGSSWLRSTVPGLRRPTSAPELELVAKLKAGLLHGLRLAGPVGSVCSALVVLPKSRVLTTLPNGPYGLTCTGCGGGDWSWTCSCGSGDSCGDVSIAATAGGCGCDCSSKGNCGSSWAWC